MPYYIAAVCENGHYATASLESTSIDQGFCEQCGSKIITKCPECGTPIRGKYHSPGLLDLTSFKVPAYCYKCGAAFPWTKSALEVATALIEEDDQLVPEAQSALIEVLPDIITETPKTNLAAIRFKKALASVGRFTAEGLRQFAIDFACELAKQQLGI